VNLTLTIPNNRVNGRTIIVIVSIWLIVNITSYTSVIKVGEVRANFLHNLNVEWEIITAESKDLWTRIHSALCNLPTESTIEMILVMTERSSEKNGYHTIHLLPAIREDGRMTTTIYG
jgi:hypothetical protein